MLFPLWFWQYISQALIQTHMYTFAHIRNQRETNRRRNQKKKQKTNKNHNTWNCWCTTKCPIHTNKPCWTAHLLQKNKGTKATGQLQIASNEPKDEITTLTNTHTHTERDESRAQNLHYEMKMYTSKISKYFIRYENYEYRIYFV